MFHHHLKVYLAPGATDLRKSIDGLSILVENQMELDLFSGFLAKFPFIETDDQLKTPLPQYHDPTPSRKKQGGV
jgi:hypothetical protein